MNMLRGQTSRGFSTSAIRNALSIKFENNAYANRPKIEEQARRDISAKLKDPNLGNPWDTYDGGRCVVAAAGIHRGGTNPRAGLHTTCRIYDASGAYVMTVHVPHDPAVYEPLFNGDE